MTEALHKFADAAEVQQGVTQTQIHAGVILAKHAGTLNTLQALLLSPTQLAAPLQRIL